MDTEGALSPRAAETENPRAPAVFYPRLEALRGIAALSVAAFHAGQSTWPDSTGHLRTFLSPAAGASVAEKFGSLVLRVVGNGNGAVVVFFVLSGFVLSGALVRGPQDIAAGAPRFLVARLFRIYPAVLATVAIFAALYWTSGAFVDGPEGYSPIGLLRNALLLDHSIDGVMWSLQLELLAVPLIFLAYRGWRRWGGVALVVPFCILAVLSFWGPWKRALGEPDMFGEIYAFVLGMAAFLVARSPVERCSPRVATLIFAGAAALLVATRPVLGWASAWSALAEAAFAAVMVALLAFGRPGLLGSMFDLGLVRFFGRISYSFYLLHPLTLMVMWKFPGVLSAVMATGVPPLLVAAVLFVASVASVTPLALAMYRWVERPGIAAGRKLSGILWQAAAAPWPAAGSREAGL